MIWPPDDRVRRAFADTAKRYDDLARRRFRRIAREMIDAAAVSRRDHILDVACGSGLVARVLTEKGLPRPVGLDISMELMQLAPPGPLVCADAMNLPMKDEVYDVVLCSLGIQMFRDPDTALKEMHRVLKEGGRVALTEWGRNTQTDIDEALFHELSSILQDKDDHDPSRWLVPQVVIGEAQEMKEAFLDNGFREPEVRARRKRSAFRDAAHYFDMMSVFPGVWARLNSLTHSEAEIARDRAINAIEEQIGHAGTFEVIDEVLISTARR
jgi:ubiquinone/menaquinone biosynthesis C-methylase UbiE